MRGIHKRYDVMIVGAGFAGSVLAERLASSGRKVLLLDRRPHIGGNAYDHHDDRYGKPLMHTETNMLRGKDCPVWLWKQWMNVLRLRRDGVPILGFTWYSLIDQIDWDIALAEQRETVNPCGLFSLDQAPNSVSAEYRVLVEEFGGLSLFPDTAVPA